ncbi:MAG TPA: cation transporter, partial [Tepidisphaeraceae bacterium]|nr:cation transporter [Tepidisphaeraceae bacterium]
MSQTAEKSSSQETSLQVNGMTCASCVSHVQSAAAKTAGVQSASVNLARGRAVVQFDPTRTSPEQIAAAISNVGYPAQPETSHSAHAEEEHLHHQAEHAQSWLRRAIIGIALWFPVEAIHWLRSIFSNHQMQMGPDWMVWLSLITSTIAIVYVGSEFYRSAFKALKRFTSNMDTLIAMGAS